MILSSCLTSSSIVHLQPSKTWGKKILLLLFRVKILINLPNKHGREKPTASHLGGNRWNHLCLSWCLFKPSEDADQSPTWGREQGGDKQNLGHGKWKASLF